MLHKFINDTCTIRRDADHLRRTIELSTRLGITIYDSLFLAVAEKYKTRVLTADRKLADTLKSKRRGAR